MCVAGRMGVVLMVVVLGTGCVSSRSGKVYSRSDAQRVQIVDLGVVEAVNEVRIEGTRTPLGAIAGGVAGGALGSRVGRGGDAKVIGTVLGALVGAATGALGKKGSRGAKALRLP